MQASFYRGDKDRVLPNQKVLLSVYTKSMSNPDTYGRVVYEIYNVQGICSSNTYT